MKFDFNKKYTTIAIYALAVLVLTILFSEAFKNIGVFFAWLKTVIGFVQPFVNGLAFAFLLNPLLRALDDRLLAKLFRDKLKPGRRRVIALMLTYLITLTVIALFIALVLPQIITSLTSLADNISSYVAVLDGFYARVMGSIRSVGQGTDVEALASSVLARVVDSLDNMLDQASDYLSSLVVPILTATQHITTGIINLLLGVIVSIYLLMDREKLFAQLRKLLRAVCSNRVYDLVTGIALDSNRILSGFVVGKVIDSLIIGLLCFIGMSVLRLPYAMLISVIVGVTNVIPYFGPFIGAIPSFFIIYAQSPIQSLWFLLFILLLQQFDGNILGPKILGDSIGLSALWVMFSIMLFSGLLGILGMFIGVPLFAIIYSLIKRVIAFLLTRKGESTNTRDYASEKNPMIK